MKHLALVIIAAGLLGGCAGPNGPSIPLPFVSQTETMRYFHEAGDTIEIARQEAFNAWAMDHLGVRPPQAVEYRKYFSRDAMGRYTGQANTNGFAEPEQWRVHTIWPFDNHEVVHVYTALIGRPSDFFNEGIAVSLQVDPARNDFTVRFNGQQVHDACRAYLAAGALPLPLAQRATTDGFRAVSDTIMSYRMAGSFVLYLTERFGLPSVQAFFRNSTRGDSLNTIRARMQSAFGVTIEQAEADWLEMLRR